MGYYDFVNKVRNMSPMGRHFTSAAMGVGAFGVALAGGMALGTGLVGMAATLGGSFVVSQFTDPQEGYWGPVPKDLVKNFGCFLGAYMAAPYVLGAALNAVASNEIEQPETDFAMESRTEQLAAPAPAVPQYKFS